MTCSIVKADDDDPANGRPASPEATMPGGDAATCSIARNDEEGPPDLVEFKPELWAHKDRPNT